MILEASLLKLHDVADVVFVKEREDPSNRIAIISPASEHDKEMVEYFASVSRNRGWNVRTYSSRAEGIGWLTQN